LQVSKDRITHVDRQWVILLATLLRASDVKDLLLPTYIFQRQSNDLTATQPVHGEQQQDGAITNVLRTVGVGTGDESLHILPRRTHRE
jgi:hypothetical protein